MMIVLALGIGAAHPAFAQTQELDSGGLGASREAWESVHGPGDLVDMASPIWGELTAYAFDGGMYYVAFSGSKEAGSGIVVSLEVAFAEGITDEDAVDAAIDPLLPSDATFADTYYLPPSPGARSALSVFRYESAALDAVPYATDTLESTFLVMKVGRIEAVQTTSAFESSMDFVTMVSRVSIAVAIPEG
jgi:hypothetical protein